MQRFFSAQPIVSDDLSLPLFEGFSFAGNTGLPATRRHGIGHFDHFAQASLFGTSCSKEITEPITLPAFGFGNAIPKAGHGSRVVPGRDHSKQPGLVRCQLTLFAVLAFERAGFATEVFQELVVLVENVCSVSNLRYSQHVSKYSGSVDG